MKTKLQRMVSVFLMVALLVGSFFAAPMESHAANNVCSQISGKSTVRTVFYVNTGSRWIVNKDVMKISQTQGIMNRSRTRISKIDKTEKMYEKYMIRIEKLGKNDKVVKSQEKVLDGKKPVKVSLDKNSKYRITVTPEYVKYMETIKSVPNGDSVYYDYNPYLTKLQTIFRIKKYQWVPRGWKTASTWMVTSTKGINACSFNK